MAERMEKPIITTSWNTLFTQIRDMDKKIQVKKINIKLQFGDSSK